MLKYYFEISLEDSSWEKVFEVISMGGLAIEVDCFIRPPMLLPQLSALRFRQRYGRTGMPFALSALCPLLNKPHKKNDPTDKPR